MPALVTDQFRILNATNFIESIDNSSNSYYVWVGLSNPDMTAFGRNNDWDDSASSVVPNPIDNFNYLSHYEDTLLFGKKITSSNIRRVIKRIDWVRGSKYDMYRHDYSIEEGKQSPVSKKYRLYDSKYYVMNSEYKVYICIQNGSNGVNGAGNYTGNQSQFEPTTTDMEPSVAGTGEDGYLWKYLFSVSPNDIIKFDSTEYITLPNGWNTSEDSAIVAVRENGDSRINNNQIKTVYIEKFGKNYSSGTVPILGDGSGAYVNITVNSSGEIISTNVTEGGTGYTYGIVDLGPLQSGQTGNDLAKLIPIIPPSYGHGYDLYKELGADKVLIYSRFDDSTRDFPINTKFCQVGILKNPSEFNSVGIFSGSEFSGLYSIKIDTTSNNAPIIGEIITQVVPSGTAVGYVASYDSDTKVLKYYKDRSLYYNSSPKDQTDYIGVSSNSNANISFSSESGSGNIIGSQSSFNESVSIGFSGPTVNLNGKIINLGVSFTDGLANPEINKKTGEIIYIDNRPLISRNIRQKEDIKIILEF